MCGLAIVINVILTSLNYQHLESIFDKQLAGAIEKNAVALLNQSRQHLTEVGLSIGLAGQSGSGATEDSIRQYLENNWDILQIEWGLDSLVVFGKQSIIWGNFENNKVVESLVGRAAASYQPETRVVCSDECRIYAATPLQFSDGSVQTLLISATMEDSIINFAQQNDMGAALLRKNTLRESSLDHSIWDYTIEGITFNGAYKDLLDVLESKVKTHAALKNGYSLTVHPEDKPKGQDFYFHTIELEDIRTEGSSLILLMTDITEQRIAIYSNLVQTLITSAIALVTTMMMLYFALKSPMLRIKRQAELLPLLAEKQFSTVRAEMQKQRRIRFTHDELDILENTAIDLSNQLEMMQDEIDHRTDELEQMALYDVLTGLANRRLFAEHLDTIIQDSKKNHERFAVIFIDLDNFKRINDSLGHDVGDELLIEVSQRLTESVRETDVVARLGGDEFTVLSPQIGDIKNVTKMLEKVVDNFQEPMLVMHHKLMITPSIGVCIGPDNGLEASELMRRADIAMYEAKASGKNCYHFFTEHNDLVH